MAFPILTVHVEVEFDTAGVEPQPWWRPFAWLRRYHDESGHRQYVARVGAIGFHLGVSVSYYPPDESVPSPNLDLF